MNNCVFSGFIGQEPEVRQVGENSVLTFSLAVSCGYGDNKSTMWIKCSAWRKERLAQYLHKSDVVTVCGELSQREYNDKRHLELNVKDIVLPARKQAENGYQENRKTYQNDRFSKPRPQPEMIPEPAADEQDKCPF